MTTALEAVPPGPGDQAPAGRPGARRLGPGFARRRCPGWQRRIARDPPHPSIGGPRPAEATSSSGSAARWSPGELLLAAARTCATVRCTRAAATLVFFRTKEAAWRSPTRLCPGGAGRWSRATAIRSCCISAGDQAAMTARARADSAACRRVRASTGAKPLAERSRRRLAPHRVSSTTWEIPRPLPVSEGPFGPGSSVRVLSEDDESGAYMRRSPRSRRLVRRDRRSTPPHGDAVPARRAAPRRSRCRAVAQ